MNPGQNTSCSEDGGSKFICDRFQTDDPVYAARKAIAHILADYRPRVPVDLSALLARRRIELCQGRVPGGKQAAIQPVRGGYKLFLATQKGPFHWSRPRFLIAHEIVETFFFCEDDEMPVHWSRLPGYRGLASQRALSSGGGEERLCDYGAGLILLPSREMEALTQNGATMPLYSALRQVARKCRTSELNLTHRIASYLGVKHGRHALVAMVTRCRKSNSQSDCPPAWRFFSPKGEKGGLPVGVDVLASLRHRVYVPTNKSLNKTLQLRALEKWLDGGDSRDSAPVGEEGYIKLNGKEVGVRLRSASFDPRWAVAILWLDVTLDNPDA